MIPERRGALGRQIARAGGYEPGGMAALFDAVAHTVLGTDDRLTAAGRADEEVMVDRLGARERVA